MSNQPQKQEKLVSVLIHKPCPKDAYAVGKVYEVTPKEVARLKKAEVAKDPPKEDESEANES